MIQLLNNRACFLYETINAGCWKSSSVKVKRWKMLAGRMINERGLINDQMIHSRTHCPNEVFRWYPSIVAAQFRIVATLPRNETPEKFFRTRRKEGKDNGWSDPILLVRNQKLRSTCVNSTQDDNSPCPKQVSSIFVFKSIDSLSCALLTRFLTAWQLLLRID